MAKKQFKTESRKMLDMMINSIYTHREIFLRELISNASDAIDKRHFRSLTDPAVGLENGEYAITIGRDKDARTMTITDNGCGMTAEELEKNLGTIARSGSLDFKRENKGADDLSVIGQFGVGFYSAFMVSDKVTVRSRAVGADTANQWESEGTDGYTVEPCDYAPVGTEVTLHLKPDTDDEKYGDFLDEYRIKGLVKKYSDYIRYPIKMECEHQQRVEEPENAGEDKEKKEPKYETVREVETLNSRVPLWHRQPKDIKSEEYDSFYTDKFYDPEPPARVIHFRTEGTVTYEALLFIPKRAPYNYYTKNYEKGIQLYSNGMMVMERCEDLIPDCFSFVRGMVDSPDFTLNISRETLQHDRQLRVIGRSIEKKIKAELLDMQEKERDKYEEFFRAFGLQLKYGVYADYGVKKDLLQDLLMYVSSREKKYVTLKEYAGRMPEGQKAIYYACGETAEAAALLPQTEAVTARGYEVLFLTEDVDEFTVQMLGKYADKEFANVSAENADLSTDEEKAALKSENEGSAELLKFMKDSIGDEVSAVRFTNTLKGHPVCLGSEGAISTEMEKVIEKMPGAEGDPRPKAQTVLEINLGHPVAASLKKLYAQDKDRVATYAKILYAQARLICGLPVKNTTELSDMICGLMAGEDGKGE